MRRLLITRAFRPAARVAHDLRKPEKQQQNAAYDLDTNDKSYNRGHRHDISIADRAHGDDRKICALHDADDPIFAANYELTTLSWGDIWTPKKGDPIQARKQASPVNHVSKNTKPLLILHSDNDRSVPIANALLMVETLKKSGAQHTFHRYPTAGHMGITKEVIARSLEFIKEHRP